MCEKKVVLAAQITKNSSHTKKASKGARSRDLLVKFQFMRMSNFKNVKKKKFPQMRSTHKKKIGMFI